MGKIFLFFNSRQSQKEKNISRNSRRSLQFGQNSTIQSVDGSIEKLSVSSHSYTVVGPNTGAQITENGAILVDFQKI